MGLRAERGLFIGQAPGGMIPVGTSGDIDLPHPEILDIASVEVRFGNLEVDAPRLLELFTQPETIEHIAAIKPDTTVDEIRELYKDPDRIVLLTAEAPSGLIVGTISVQKPGHGSRVGEGMRLVVDEKYRDLKVARKLVKTANALMFRKGEDDGSRGFGCTKSQIYVIINVDGDGIAQRVFAREGYIRGPENVRTTFSWSNKSNKLVDRSSQPMSLDRVWYIRNRQGEHMKFFPEPRPPKIV